MSSRNEPIFRIMWDLAEALDEILGLPDGETKTIEGHLEAIITETRGGEVKA